MDQKTRLEEITNQLYFTGNTPPEPEPVRSQCAQVADYYIDAREYLLEEYRKELLEHPNLYALPPLSRYVKKAVLYRKPVAGVRYAQSSFARLCAPARYRILSVTPGWNALRTDTETLYRYFIDKAHKIYTTYLYGLLTVINGLGVPAPSEGNGDALWDYVSKLSILRDVQKKMDQVETEQKAKEESR